MKKKTLIIGGVLVCIVIVVLLVFMLNKDKYTIKISLVDDRSPDRVLTIYKNEKEKIEVQRIEYLNGTLLCNGYNTTVHFGDIENIEELKVILKDGNKVKAKIVKEEVK